MPATSLAGPIRAGTPWRRRPGRPRPRGLARSGRLVPLSPAPTGFRLRG